MRRKWVLLVAATIFVIAAALGAVGDWYWWHPASGIVITLAAGATLLVALVLAVIPRTRTAGLLVAIAGIGLVAGQTLGPSRPELQLYEGTMTVTLSAPEVASGTVAVTCSMDAAGVELLVSGDPNLRLDILPDDPAVPADIDQREFFNIGLTVGDRWDRGGPAPRSDGIALTAIVGSVKADDPETRVSSAPASKLILVRSMSRGVLSFSGLVPDPDPGQPAGTPIDLVGKLIWDCGEPLSM